MARNTSQSLPALESVLRALGENLRLARLRRRITTNMMAERAGISRITLRKAESGDGSVTLAVYGKILFSLGLEEDLLPVARDDRLGRHLQDAGLTHTRQRVAKRKTS